MRSLLLRGLAALHLRRSLLFLNPTYLDSWYCKILFVWHLLYLAGEPLNIIFASVFAGLLNIDLDVVEDPLTAILCLELVVTDRWGTHCDVILGVFRVPHIVASPYHELIGYVVLELDVWNPHCIVHLVRIRVAILLLLANNKLNFLRVFYPSGRWYTSRHCDWCFRVY